jgi:ABC-type taurine transport system substrate-binding protein
MVREHRPFFVRDFPRVRSSERFPYDSILVGWMVNEKRADGFSSMSGDAVEEVISIVAPMRREKLRSCDSEIS